VGRFDVVLAQKLLRAYSSGEPDTSLTNALAALVRDRLTEDDSEVYTADILKRILNCMRLVSRRLARSPMMERELTRRASVDAGYLGVSMASYRNVQALFDEALELLARCTQEVRLICDWRRLLAQYD
jgi:hypothetical protein